MPSARATTEFAALWRGVTAAPLDAAPKLVLADWLRENDRDPDLERGLRYCAEHGRWPLKEEWTGCRVWAWYFQEDFFAPRSRCRTDEIPQTLWDHIAYRQKAGRDFAGFGGNDASPPLGALRRLGRALAAVGEGERPA